MYIESPLSEQYAKLLTHSTLIQSGSGKIVTFSMYNNCENQITPFKFLCIVQKSFFCFNSKFNLLLYVNVVYQNNEIVKDFSPHCLFIDLATHMNCFELK